MASMLSVSPVVLIKETESCHVALVLPGYGKVDSRTVSFVSIKAWALDTKKRVNARRSHWGATSILRMGSPSKFPEIFDCNGYRKSKYHKQKICLRIQECFPPFWKKWQENTEDGPRLTVSFSPAEREADALYKLCEHFGGYTH
jgi:hypothetical protein